MTKAFKILLGLSCIFYAQAVVTVENEVEDGNADLNCVMFGNVGCDASCTTLSELYDTPVYRGSCNKDAVCVCSPKQKSDLESLWYAIFKEDDTSKSALQQIKTNPTYTSKAIKALSIFPRTPQEIRDELTAILSEEVPEIKNVVTKERSLPVSEFVNDEDVVDGDELQQKASEILQNSISNNLFQVPNTDYDAELATFFDTTTNNQTRKEVFEAIHQSGNSFLKKYLEPPRCSKDFDFSTIADFPSYMVVSDYVATAVTNGFLKNIDNPDNTKTLSYMKYKTPKFEDFPSVTDNGPAISKNYEMPGGKVFYERKENGNVEIKWMKDNVRMVFIRESNGKLEQRWRFGDDVDIHLKKDTPNDLNQYWNIEGRTYSYRQSPGRTTARGTASKQDVEEYKEEIDTWCAQNSLIILPNLCVIYKR